MNKHKTNRIWLVLTILVMAALACQPGGPGPVVTQTPGQTESTPVATGNGGLSSEDRGNLVNATVQVLMQFKKDGEFVSLNWGSGTIISADGMIVTNAHVASPASQGDPDNEPDRLVIALFESEDKPPVPSYIATLEAVDGYLDLAVLQINATVDGSSVDTADLHLPFVEMGNPTEIHIGDHLNIIGFPAIGGETITYTDGNVSGFASEDQIGERAWIKTDATISGGNSGGLAADDDGKIVGVPTSLGQSGSGMDCRPQQDTNDNGQLDDGDFCVPISNFIADVRPINFAKPLIDAAQSGKIYASPYRLPGVVGEDGTGGEAAANFVWLDTADSSTETCKWSEETVDAYTASQLCIAAGFEYSGMTNGEQVRELWYLNGEAVSDYPFSWEWDAEGRFATYLPNAGDPMPVGEYYLEMHAGADDHLIGTSDKVAVGNGDGGPTPPQPSQKDTVAVYGVITDADTNKPIPGALACVVQGVTYEEWASKDFADKYVVLCLQVESKGQFEFTGVPRGVPFTYGFAAEGYINAAGDDIAVPVDDPATRFEMNIALTK
jgi:serine protease Do